MACNRGGLGSRVDRPTTRRSVMLRVSSTRGGSPRGVGRRVSQNSWGAMLLRATTLTRALGHQGPWMPTLLRVPAAAAASRDVWTHAQRSERCFGKASGTPLTEYTSQSEAEQGAAYARMRYGTRLVPYACKACGQWHLSPEDRVTPSTYCRTCCNADGTAKKAYLTRAAAERRAAIVLQEHWIKLDVYPCESGHGWHLTSG